MFVSVMTILHERLPCAQFYFRQHRKYKQNHQEKMLGMGSQDGEGDENIKSRSSLSRSPLYSPDNRAEQSTVTAIASPNLIRGYSPTIAKTTNLLSSESRMQSLMVQHSKFNDNAASEFRIKHSSNGVNESPVRNKAMYNSQNSA